MAQAHCVAALLCCRCSRRLRLIIFLRCQLLARARYRAPLLRCCCRCRRRRHPRQHANDGVLVVEPLDPVLQGVELVLSEVADVAIHVLGSDRHLAQATGALLACERCVCSACEHTGAVQGCRHAHAGMQGQGGRVRVWAEGEAVCRAGQRL